MTKINTEEIFKELYERYGDDPELNLTDIKTMAIITGIAGTFMSQVKEYDLNVIETVKAVSYILAEIAWRSDNDPRELVYAVQQYLKSAPEFEQEDE